MKKHQSESKDIHTEFDDSGDTLRQKAEGRLWRQRAEERKEGAEVSSDTEGANPDVLLEELSVHRLELEVQNEELRQSQRDLQSARDRYAALYERAPVAFLTLSTKGKILTCNKAAEKLFETSQQKIIGQPIHYFVLPESQDDLHLHHYALIKDSNRQASQLRLRKKSPGTITVLLESEVDRRFKPGTLTWFASLTDISDQKNLEHELFTLNQELEKRVQQRTREYQASRQEIIAVLNAAADPIVTIDGQARIQTLNRATSRVFGYAEDELLGSSLSRLMTESGAMLFSNALKACAEEVVGQAPSVRRESLCLHKNGERIPVEMALARVDEEENFTAIFRDLREKRRLEWEVMQIAEDERSRISRELHDSLGQELAAMSLDTRVIFDDLAETNHTAAEKFIGFSAKLQECIAELRTIIFDLAPIDVSDGGLTDALEALTRSIPEQEVKCSFHLSHPECINELSREMEIQLLRIAQEAVHNARKHSEAKQIVISLSGKDDSIELQIIDDGHGVPSKKQSAYSGQGLRIMQYRCSLVGGDLKITGFNPHGTKVVCRVERPQNPREHG